jgi:hypothetical protein
MILYLSDYKHQSLIIDSKRCYRVPTLCLYVLLYTYLEESLPL